MKKFFAIVLLIILTFNLCACGKPDEVVEVEKLIDAIGEVSITSGAAISAAQESYNALPVEFKEKVANADILQQAIEKYEDIIHYEIKMDKYIMVQSTEDGKTITHSDFVFNEDGLIIQQTDTSNNSSVHWAYEYDNNGNLIKKRTELGTVGYQQTDYIYDENNLLIKECVTSDLPGVKTYEKEYNNSVDEYGRILQYKATSTDSDNTYVQVYAYDNGGGISSIKESIEGYSYYFTTNYRYDVYGNKVRENIKDNSGAYEWTNEYQYQAVSDYSISSLTDTSLKSKEKWVGFEEIPALPMPDDVLSTAQQCRKEEGSACVLYSYIITDTKDCGKYLNVLSQVCGFNVEFADEDTMIIGRVLDDNKSIAEFSLQVDEKLGLIFAFGITNT